MPHCAVLTGEESRRPQHETGTTPPGCAHCRALQDQKRGQSKGKRRNTHGNRWLKIRQIFTIRYARNRSAGKVTTSRVWTFSSNDVVRLTSSPRFAPCRLSFAWYRIRCEMVRVHTMFNTVTNQNDTVGDTATEGSGPEVIQALLSFIKRCNRRRTCTTTTKLTSVHPAVCHRSPRTDARSPCTPPYSKERPDKPPKEVSK